MTDPGVTNTPPAPQEAMFTQSQVNSFIKSETDKVAARYSDYNDLKTAVSGHEAAIKKARDEAAAETSTKYRARLVSGEARSLARDLGFHDPDDALSVIKSDALPVKDDDEVDSDAIKKSLEDLVKAKPYLVKAPDQKPTPRQRPGIKTGDKPAEDSNRPVKASDALRELAKKRRNT